MFREKLKKNQDERGYLYIRESQYVRDRRTLKRKPSKLCDGVATKQRGKYSKKKDIYCGKIYEIEIKNILTFSEYIINYKNLDYMNFKLTSSFEEIIDSFVEYLIYSYGLDGEEFYDKKTRKVYAIGSGYLSNQIINWLKRFVISGDFGNLSEMKRFYFRCDDCAIFDDEIKELLYVKLVPDVAREEVEKEIEELKKYELDTQKATGLKDFLKKNQEN